MSVDQTFDKIKEIVSPALRWFTFAQNNSGGVFVVDENVCEYVIIQAFKADEAVAKAETFMDNSDSCPCCGDRWSFWIDDKDGTQEPEIYGEPVKGMKAEMYRRACVLHYNDGRKERIELLAT